jgi:hypothetical protein
LIFYEPDKRDRGVLPHDPFKSLVVPRPIGWISTMDTAGLRPIARSGGPADYTIVERIFQMTRPTS